MLFDSAGFLPLRRPACYLIQSSFMVANPRAAAKPFRLHCHPGASSNIMSVITIFE